MKNTGHEGIDVEEDSSENDIRDETNLEDDVLLTEQINTDEAKREEIQSWIQNGVFEEVKESGQR